MVDTNSKINSNFKRLEKHFQSHGRTKEFSGHSSKVLLISICKIKYHFQGNLVQITSNSKLGLYQF